MNKKNILFVLPMIPWPLSSGGHQAMYNGILAVKDVSNIYLTFPVYANEKIEKVCEEFIKDLGGKVQLLPFIVADDESFVRKASRHLKDFLERKIINTASEYTLNKVLNIKQVSQKEIEYVNYIIKQHDIDIVQVEMLEQITIVNSLPSHVRKVFVHHELGYVKNGQLLSEYGANDYYKSKYENYKIEEIGLLNHYDDVIVLSDIDRQKLQNEGVKVPVHTSFAVVKSAKAFAPQINDYHNIVFIGAPKHRPNFLAVIWFLDNCWDKLLSIDPDYKLKIIGLWDNERMKTISEKYNNIVFTGFVDDLGDELKNGIMVVPITVGSGIRMKILEAANYGIPVVSTSIGAEGLPLIDGKNAFIADEASVFVEKVLQLKDRALRETFVNNMKSTIDAYYSIDSLKKNRIKIYEL